MKYRLEIILTLIPVYVQSAFAIDEDIYIKQKVGQNPKWYRHLPPPSSALFPGYRLDSVSLGLSNIRWRYSQLLNLYRIKYFPVYPICVISHVRHGDAAIPVEILNKFVPNFIPTRDL